ncbi:MAG: LytTR family DNA-binding domain-containing protein [Bacteroidota bacterium]
MKTKVVIIEDEPKAQKHLTNLLGASGFMIHVIAVLPNVKSSIKWLSENVPPDLIFMDIHLSDGISFDIFKEVDVEVPIIFTTAYDEYAIMAFKTTGIDYLLKPLTSKEVNQGLMKFFNRRDMYLKEWLDKFPAFTQLYKKDRSNEKRERFLLKSGKEMVPVRLEGIAYFFRSEIVFAKTMDGKQFSISQSLNQLQTLVDPKKFIRLNRQLLVNIDSIEKVKTSNVGQLMVELNPKYHEDVLVSPERASVLKKFLGHI